MFVHLARRGGTERTGDEWLSVNMSLFDLPLECLGAVFPVPPEHRDLAVPCSECLLLEMKLLCFGSGSGAHLWQMEPWEMVS
ncbi:hypothetical protein E2C01_021596 [Portunus trituberculatus]|uniref:Uncharacterized protein n=1 Tax=Portunus trituberculatus TaxID=210409 RepID=A0A5B7E2Z3_PORTR|nr:hypothetical protein [Portunus trituberculatus]